MLLGESRVMSGGGRMSRWDLLCATSVSGLMGLIATDQTGESKLDWMDLSDSFCFLFPSGSSIGAE